MPEAGAQADMTATVGLVIDPTQVKRVVNKTKEDLERGLTNAGTRAGAAAGQSMSRSVSEISGKIKAASEQIGGALTKSLGIASLAGGASIGAFLKSGTSDAMKFKARLAEVNGSLAGVGQKLAMTTKFGGKTAYEWAEKLSTALSGLDTARLQRIADIVSKIAIASAAIKGVSAVSGLVQGLSGLAGLGGKVLNMFTSNGNTLISSAKSTYSGNSVLAAAAGAGIGSAIGNKSAINNQFWRNLQQSGDVRAVPPSATSSATDSRWGSSTTETYGKTATTAATASAVTAASKTKMMLSKLWGGKAGVRSGLSAVGGTALGMFTNPLVLAAGTAEISRRILNKNMGYNVSYGEISSAVMDNFNWRKIGHYGTDYGDTIPGGYSNETFSKADTLSAVRQNQEAVRALAFGRSDIFKRYLTGQTSYSSLSDRYALEDVQYSPNRKTSRSLRPRAQELNKARADAEKSAADFKTKMEEDKAAGRPVNEVYKQAYDEAYKRVIDTTSAITEIYKLRDTENETAKKLRTREKEELKKEERRTTAETTSRKYAAIDRANEYKDLEERYKKNQRRRIGTLNMGVALDQLPNMTSEVFNEAASKRIQMEEDKLEYEKTTTRMKEEDRRREEANRLEDTQRAEDMKIMLSEIRDAITGAYSGAPVE